jgi:hypothetical protein
LRETPELTMSPNSPRFGPVVVLALFCTAMLVAAGAISFGVIQNRSRQVHQTASWQEALFAAESGVDIALHELRTQLSDRSNAWKDWSVVETAPEDRQEPPAAIKDGGVSYETEVLLREGAGGQRSYAKIVVDAPLFLQDSPGEQWYRVRAFGIAETRREAAGSANKSGQRQSKFTQPFERRASEASPKTQATRLIEAIVKPVRTSSLTVLGWPVSGRAEESMRFCEVIFGRRPIFDYEVVSWFEDVR